jgi:type IV secretion system protein VirB4
VAFQPLADVDEPRERVWAAGWLETLAELQGITVTPPRRLRLDRALTLLAAEPRAHRTLTELTVQLQDPELVAAFAQYTMGGPFGRLLDATTDTIDAGRRWEATEGASAARGGGPGGGRVEEEETAHRYQVFELRALLDLDDRVLVPVLLHLFRHVERRLDGSPTLIVIEELWAPLLRTVFARRIQQWLLTLRKQNAAVVLVAHSPAQLDGVPAREIIIESCPTRVLLPNPEAATPAGATRYRDLGLNDRELGILATAVPKRDYYVKSPLGSRLVRLDLGPVALAFLGTPDGRSPDELRPEVAALAAREGPAWPAAWARSHGAAPPHIARSAEGLYVAHDGSREPPIESHFHMEDLPNADLAPDCGRARDVPVV